MATADWYGGSGVPTGTYSQRPKTKPKKRPSSKRQGVRIPRAVSAPNQDMGGGTGSINPPTPTTTTPLSQAAAPAPGMSSYEKRRKSILDIMNDPELAAYNQSYTPNYEIARSQVENAFAQAMGEVQSRQAAGQSLLATMPGQITSNYGNATANIDSMAANNAAAQEASGLRGFGNEGAELAPVKAGLAMEQAGALSSVPTLGVGLSNLVSQQRQQLQTDRGNSLSDIAMQEEDARRQAANDGPSWVQQQLIQEEMAAEETKNQKKKNSAIWGEDYIGQDRGGDVAKNYPQLTTRLRSGQGEGASQEAYDFVRSGLRSLSGLGPNKQKAQLAKIMAEARKRWPHKTKAISLAMFEVMG